MPGTSKIVQQVKAFATESDGSCSSPGAHMVEEEKEKREKQLTPISYLLTSRNAPWHIYAHLHTCIHIHIHAFKTHTHTPKIK